MEKVLIFGSKSLYEPCVHISPEFKSSSSSSLSLFTYLLWFICIIILTNGVHIWIMGMEHNIHVNSSKKACLTIYKHFLFQPKNPTPFSTYFKTCLLLFCCDLKNNLVFSVYENNKAYHSVNILKGKTVPFKIFLHITVFSICTHSNVNY